MVSFFLSICCSHKYFGLAYGGFSADGYGLNELEVLLLLFPLSIYCRVAQGMQGASVLECGRREQALNGVTV